MKGLQQVTRADRKAPDDAASSGVALAETVGINSHLIQVSREESPGARLKSRMACRAQRD